MSLLGRRKFNPSLQMKYKEKEKTKVSVPINDKRKKVFIRSLLGLPMFWHSNKAHEIAFSTKIVQEIT